MPRHAGKTVLPHGYWGLPAFASLSMAGSAGITMRTYFRVSTTHDGKNTMNEHPGLKDVLDKIDQLRTISMPPGVDILPALKDRDSSPLG